MTDDASQRPGSAPAGGTAASDPAASSESLVRESAHGRNFSYFSHRVFVAFQPVDLHDYLSRLIEIVPTGSPAASPATDSLDEIDAELIRWVLLHRSQLNVLALNRLVEALRGKDDLMMLPSGGALRTDEGYRIDMTLQFAIELELGNPRFAAWVEKRPRLQQPMIDAAYYVSRRWLEQDRAGKVLGETRAAGFDTIDLGPGGRDAFRAYLLHRMNLREDDVVTRAAEVREQRALRDAMALTEQELSILYSVAVGVALTMAFTTDIGALRLRWNECVKQSRAGAMSTPTQSLFDALWLGPTKSLLYPADDVPDRLVFKWRYLPSGEAAPPPSLQSLVDDVDEEDRDLDYFADLDRLVREATPFVHIGEQHILAMLARCRILPATPAWESVASARTNINHARDKVGNPETLRRDVTTLREYRDMIRSAPAARAVQATLLVSTFLANAVLQAEPFPLDKAMGALSDGLQLSDASLPEAARRLVDLWSELTASGIAAQGELVKPIAFNPGEWAAGPVLRDAVTKAASAGMVARSSTSMTTQTELAWAKVVARLKAFSSNPSMPMPMPLASAAEVVCAVRRQGPFELLSFALGTMTPLDWTRAMLRSLAHSASPTRLATDATPEILAWIATCAGARLGMGAINPDMQSDLIRVFGGDTEAQLRQAVTQSGLWSGHGRFARIAIVICNVGPSLTDSWVDPPNGGLLLAIRVSEARDLAGPLFDALMKTAKEAVVIAWEPPAPGEADEKFILDKLLGALGPSMKRPVWIYRGTALGTHSPQVVDPTQADDLWLSQAAP